MLVVSDNSPIRYLRVLACDHVLPVLFGRVLIPRAVLRALQHPHAPGVVRTWMVEPPTWLAVQSIAGPPDAGLARLEAGEQEAIVLAQELRADTVTCPRCGQTAEMAIETFFGYGNLIEYCMGDSVVWHPGESIQHEGARPI